MEPQKGSKRCGAARFVGRGGGQESGRCHRNHHSFADNQSQGKYRYKINALNTVSYYIWFFRKRKKKIFCGTFSLTLLRERGMLFDIGICRYMHLLYKVEKTSGDGNRWLGLQPERFFSWSLGSGRVKCQAVGRYIIQRAVRWPGPVHLIMASGLLLDNPAHSPSLLEISMLPVLPELNPCNQTDFKMVLLYVF